MSRPINHFNLEKMGFTFIEVLVVIVIISIVSTSALLAFHVNQRTALHNFVIEFVDKLQFAQEAAMLKPAVLGLAKKDSSLVFLQYDSVNKTKWQMLVIDGLLPLVIPDNVRVMLNSTANSHAKSDPAIIFSQDGVFTPFVFIVGTDKNPQQFKIEGASNQSIQVKELSL